MLALTRASAPSRANFGVSLSSALWISRRRGCEASSASWMPISLERAASSPRLSACARPTRPGWNTTRRSSARWSASTSSALSGVRSPSITRTSSRSSRVWPRMLVRLIASSPVGVLYDVMTTEAAGTLTGAGRDQPPSARRQGRSAEGRTTWRCMDLTAPTPLTTDVTSAVDPSHSGRDPSASPASLGRGGGDEPIRRRPTPADRAGEGASARSRRGACARGPSRRTSRRSGGPSSAGCRRRAA